MISCICIIYTWYRVSTYDILFWGDKMTSKAKLEANERWNKKQDSFLLRLPKGNKDKLDAFIKSICPDKSRNQFINEAIEQKMQWEQEHYDKLPDAKKFYRSEEGRAAIEKLAQK